MAAEECQKSDQLEDFDVKEFLSSCKLDDYYAEFISLGYDCLEYISQMDEAQLNKLTADVGLNKKPGHKMHFVAKLKVYISKSKNKESEAVESKETGKSSTQSVNSQDHVPRYVKDLHIPNPLTDEHKFYNDLLHELIQAMYLLVSPEQFRQYYLSQRILRWKLQCKVNTILTNVQKFSDKECKDGNVMNIVKYTTSDIKSFKAGDVKRIENTLEYVNHFKLKSLTKCKDSLKSYRSGLFNHDHDIKFLWKANELNFYDNALEKLTEPENQIEKIVSELLTVLTELKGVHFQINITEKEEKRAIKRKRDNSQKDQKEKRKRLLEKCVDVLGLSLDPKNPEIGQYLVREQYDAIQITGENIITDPSKLRPRKHLSIC